MGTEATKSNWEKDCEKEEIEFNADNVKQMMGETGETIEENQVAEIYLMKKNKEIILKILKKNYMKINKEVISLILR